MKLVMAEEQISIDEIRQMAAGRFGDLVKAVVDIARGVMLLDAELHADDPATRDRVTALVNRLVRR